MADPRLRIDAGVSLSSDQIASRQFPTVRRGYDQAEVRSFLQRVAADVQRLGDRLADVERQLGDARTPATSQRMDIATLTSALGEETARVLRFAQEAAVDLKARADEGASRVLSDAHTEAARVRTEAESVLAKRSEEADAHAERLRADAQAEMAARRAKATAEAEAIVAAAVERGREMVAEAQAARERMLTDLSRRRKSALTQIEQLQAGRDRLLEAYATVRSTLGEITRQLESADSEARQQAAALSRRFSAANDPTSVDVSLDDAGAPTLTTVGASVSEALSDAAALAASEAMGEGAAPKSRPVPPGSDGDPPAGDSQPTRPATPGRTIPTVGPSPSPSPSASPAPAPPSPSAGSGQAAGSPQAAGSGPSGQSAGSGQSGPSGQSAGSGQSGQSPRPAQSGPPAQVVQPGQAASPVSPPLRPASPAAAVPPAKATGSGRNSGTSRSAGGAPTSGPGGSGGSRGQAARERIPSPVVADVGARPQRSPLPPSDAAPTATLPASAVGRSPTRRPERPNTAASPKRDANGGVDQLFARMRADQSDSVAAEPDVLVEESELRPDETTDPRSPSPQASAPAAGGPERLAFAQADEMLAERHTEENQGDRPRSDAEERLLIRRDEIVDRFAVPLVRKLKRSLQDEQNVALDRLRTHNGRVTIEVLLPPASDHLQAYVAIVAPVLYEVERAGGKLAGESGPVAKGTKADQQSLAALADNLAATIVEPLRARIERAVTDDANDDVSVRVDGVSVAYREWKSSRLESLVGDQVSSAITLGACRVLIPGTPVYWIADDPEGPCPDCDDNSLAGPTVLGDSFPTGQVGPPAHPGCRCLLTPMST